MQRGATSKVQKRDTLKRSKDKHARLLGGTLQNFIPSCSTFDLWCGGVRAA